MEELYSETYLNAKPSFKRMTARICLITLCILLLVILSCTLGFIGLSTSILIDVLIIYFLPSTKIAYEYIFVDGQIDFDMIIKGEKRKTKKRIDLEKAELITREGAPALHNYKNSPLYDYSSGNENDENYIIVVRNEKGTQRIKFTPDEKMLSNIKIKAKMKFQA